MLFDMLAKRPYGSLLPPNSRFQFSILLHETIPLTTMECVQHGSGQIGKRLKRELHFMLKVCVLRALFAMPIPPRNYDARSSRFVGQIRLPHLNQRNDSTMSRLDGTSDGTRTAAEQLSRAET
jgi:hypothetical protein